MQCVFIFRYQPCVQSPSHTICLYTNRGFYIRLHFHVSCERKTVRQCCMCIWFNARKLLIITANDDHTNIWWISIMISVYACVRVFTLYRCLFISASENCFFFLSHFPFYIYFFSFYFDGFIPQRELLWHFIWYDCFWNERKFENSFWL